MKIGCERTGFECELEKVRLEFTGKSYADVFGLKNNKTVAQTLEHRRYSKLKSETTARYADRLHEPLGIFLLELKQHGDSFYTRFLNKYGDLIYSEFFIADKKYLESRGIYAYFAGKELKYIGRCKDSMKKRVNQGYGKIHPKNCYLDGQATNCHLNARITDAEEDITLWLCHMESLSEIEAQERALIRAHEPPWNIQRG